MVHGEAERAAIYLHDLELSHDKLRADLDALLLAAQVAIKHLERWGRGVAYVKSEHCWAQARALRAAMEEATR
ncbi:hypothetical protein LCGC14_1996000 [marine sediment metagenome]|uniref:Uncharacterized protein n=1 Tax=marine sediment metagenome TaxID=412755 RepID=A0A0F9F4I8_9ZZZZ